MMGARVCRVPTVKADSQEPTFRFPKMLSTSALFALGDHRVPLVRQVVQETQDRKVEMVPPEVLANQVVLDLKDPQDPKRTMVDLDSRGQRVPLAKTEPLAPKDRSVMLDHLDHLAKPPAKATMESPVKLAPQDLRDHLDRRATRQMMALLANLDLPVPQGHLAKMLSIVLARRAVDAHRNSKEPKCKI